MSRPLRWLAFSVIALLVICGALLAATDLQVPPLATGSVQGKLTQVSSAIYAVTLLSLSLGWTLALTAALLMPLAARLLLLAPVIVLLVSGPVMRLADGSGQVNPPSVAELWLRAAQLVILGRWRCTALSVRVPAHVAGWAGSTLADLCITFGPSRR